MTPKPTLDQLLAQRRERPMLDLLRQRQGAQEVGEVVGEGVELEPHRVVPGRTDCLWLQPLKASSLESVRRYQCGESGGGGEDRACEQDLGGN